MNDPTPAARILARVCQSLVIEFANHLAEINRLQEKLQKLEDADGSVSAELNLHREKLRTVIRIAQSIVAHIDAQRDLPSRDKLQIAAERVRLQIVISDSEKIIQ